jgi:hypothetical protein
MYKRPALLLTDKIPVLNYFINPTAEKFTGTLHYSSLLHNPILKIKLSTPRRKRQKMEKNKTKIEEARHEFGQREFEKTLTIYQTIPPNLLNDLDGKIIEHCKNVLNITDDKAK